MHTFWNQAVKLMLRNKVLQNILAFSLLMVWFWALLNLDADVSILEQLGVVRGSFSSCLSDQYYPQHIHVALGRGEEVLKDVGCVYPDSGAGNGRISLSGTGFLWFLLYVLGVCVS